jgi:predicted permease
MWATLIRDLRCAQRQWKKSPVFVFTAVSTLALGIGMATALFSIVYGVLLKPLPYEHSNRLVDLRELNGQGQRMHLADANFDDIRAQNNVFEGMAGYITEISSVVNGSGEPKRIGMAIVSKDFFKVMRVHPLLGRTFLPDEQHVGASQAVLVGYRLWRNQLDTSTDLASKKLTIDGHPAMIVGVLPDGFDFPEASEIWAPHELYETTPSRTAHNQEAVARLRDGVSLTQARAELDAIAQRLKRQYGQDIDMTSVSVVPLHGYLTSDVQKPLWILLGSMGLLLLIAFANVTSLLLARQAAREREAAVRAALGANWKRMMQQQFAETLLIAMIACVLGALLAEAAVRAISSFASQSVPRWESVEVSVPVLAAAIAVSLLIAAGLALLATSRSTRASFSSVSARDHTQNLAAPVYCVRDATSLLVRWR